MSDVWEGGCPALECRGGPWDGEYRTSTEAVIRLPTGMYLRGLSFPEGPRAKPLPALYWVPA